MSNSINRRDFIKGMAAGIATLGVSSICGVSIPAKADGIYTPGTYSATEQGLSLVTVTMTFDTDSITDVQLDVAGETPTIGQAAAQQLKDALMASQSADIDAVSGASLTSNAVKKAAAKCIAQAKGEISIEEKSGEEKSENWLGTEPSDINVSETWDTDIVIVGAGNAGCAAGAYASKQGYNFRLIEKMDSVGRTRNWYGAVDSADILAAGEAPMDKAKLRRELERYASGKINMEAYSTWLNESADMHEFVKEVYAKYSPDSKLSVTTGSEAAWPEDDGYMFPVIEHTWSRSAKSRNEMFQAYLEDNGYAIDFNTVLVKIEKNDERVTGVIAQNSITGEYIRINAAKGVILTSGGYVGNTAMMEQLDPMGSSVITTNVGNPQNTGDGIKAAVWAGALMQAEPAPMLFDRGIVPPGVDAGYKTLENGAKVFPSTEGQFNFGTQPFLKVNRHGKRFTNESGPYDNMSYASFNQPGCVYAQIFDSGVYEDVQRFHTIGCSAQARNSTENVMKQYEGKIEAGQAFKADTLEELADKLGFAGKDKDNFLTTCERYNELYDMGADEDFGKPAYRLSELRKPPFYGAWFGASLLTTEQGVIINSAAEVLDTNREPMAGLYAAGDCSGGFVVNNYPCLMPGLACGKAMTYGIKAVKSAAGEE